MIGRRARRAWERFSLQTKLPALFVAALLASILCVSWHGYRAATGLLTESVDRQLRLLAVSADALVAGDYHDRALGPGAVGEEEYGRIRRELARLAGQAEVDCLYAMSRAADGSFRITASSLEADAYWDEYADPWEALERTEADGQERFDSEYEPSSARWLRSIVVRRLSPGGRPYFVGADMALSDIQALRERQWPLFAGAGLGSFALMGLIGILAARMITRPLKRLSDFAEETCRSGFDGARSLDASLLPLSGRAADEVRLLAKNFQGMQGEISAHMRRLAETVSARERVESEMRIAGEMQLGLLPRGPLAAPALEACGAMVPAKAAGGDFYDFFWLDRDRLAFAVGDVSGKGVSAALYMATSLTLLRAYARDMAGQPDSAQLAAGLLRRVDAALAEHNPSLQFVTALFGILDCATGAVAIANGGHHPPFRLRAGGRPDPMALPAGCVLGVGLGGEFSAARLALEPGETLFLYTDGIPEAFSAQGAFFGEARLRALLDQGSGWPPGSLVERAVSEVQAFSQGRDLADDITAMAIRWKGPPEGNRGLS